MKLRKITALGLAAALMIQTAGCAAGKTEGKQETGTASSEAAALSESDVQGKDDDGETSVSEAAALSESEVKDDEAGNAESPAMESNTDSRNGSSSEQKQNTSRVIGDPISREGYTLQKAVVLSRHNIRSPLSDKGSALDTMTNHEWFDWSSNPSELSVRGGILETEMGEYFRKWLEKEALFPENYRPSEDEVRFYANSKQRTIATANFFKAGLLPVADTEVEYHSEYDTMDPVFEPKLTYISDTYIDDAREQIFGMYEEVSESLSDKYELLSDVIDVKESQDFKEGKFTGFSLDDLEIVLEAEKEPGMNGSLKTATTVSDALTLQYYEGDDETAAFGKDLTREQWEDLASIKDIYQDLLFTAPLVSVNVANPLLREINAELGLENRKFTFLCGHDSNISSVLAALEADDYELPDSIEKKTPIGCKLLFTCWMDSEGKEYTGIDLVYQMPEQLKAMPVLDLENAPACAHIALQGLTANADGLYEADQVAERIQKAIGKYEEIEEKYSMAAAA